MFDLAEPQLDLLEPGRRRIGWGKVEVDPRVVFKELADQAGLVGREVVEDDMNLLSGRTLGDDFFEEGNKVLAGVAGRGFAVHVAGGRFQRGVQGQCSVAVVLETLALDPSRGKWQDGIEPIQGLNGPEWARKRCFQRLMVGAVVPSRSLMEWYETPSASSSISRARNTYPAGKDRVVHQVIGMQD